MRIESFGVNERARGQKKDSRKDGDGKMAA